MKIVVDTEQDITQLFKLISDKIKENNEKATCLIENYIIVTFENVAAKKVIAECIASFIIDEFEQRIAAQIIKPFELMKTENDEILSALDADENLKSKRKDILKNEIKTAFSGGHINIDGMVKFRLEEYKKELQFTLELLVDEFSAKKSYDEFIGLMKYFTEIQTPVTDTVVLSETEGEYKLTDSSGKPINLKFDEEFADELMPMNLTGEDLLISNLMAAMPKKIVLKNVNTDKPIINTISRIFEGRITH